MTSRSVGESSRRLSTTAWSGRDGPLRREWIGGHEPTCRRQGHGSAERPHGLRWKPEYAARTQDSNEVGDPASRRKTPLQVSGLSEPRSASSPSASTDSAWRRSRPSSTTSRSERCTSRCSRSSHSSLSPSTRVSRWIRSPSNNPPVTPGSAGSHSGTVGTVSEESSSSTRRIRRHPATFGSGRQGADPTQRSLIQIPVRPRYVRPHSVRPRASSGSWRFTGGIRKTTSGDLVEHVGQHLSGRRTEDSAQRRGPFPRRLEGVHKQARNSVKGCQWSPARDQSTPEFAQVIPEGAGPVKSVGWPFFLPSIRCVGAPK
jgi:hypothetical protein